MSSSASSRPTAGRRLLEQLGDLEIIPRRKIEYRGTTLEEMDLDAVLARHPRSRSSTSSHTRTCPGAGNAKRWEDIEELLDAGIDVISTVNIQHLESLNDVVEGITGISQRETVPDAWVRGADQIELVDSTPEALRRRMAHGNIYPAERIDAALGNYFREGNLSALRELALLWVADRVDEALTDYRIRHGIDRPVGDARAGRRRAHRRARRRPSGAPRRPDGDARKGRADRRPHPKRRRQARAIGRASRPTPRALDRARRQLHRDRRAATSPRRSWTSRGPSVRPSS